MNTWRKYFIVLFIVVGFVFGVMPPAEAVFKVPFFRKTPSQQKVAKKTDLPVVGPAGEQGPTSKKSTPLEIVIPEGAGHIVESYKSKDNNKIVIHIQDIHTNYEAQKNLSRIIEALINDHKLKLVMVEGGWGDVSLTYLRDYATKERRLEVAEEYLKEGKISGEEYLNIYSDYDMDIAGVEEEQLYNANLDAFFAIEKFRKSGTEELAGIRRAAESLKEKLYPAQIQELEKTARGYADNKIKLVEYYNYINNLAAKSGIDLSAYPDFVGFMKVATLEKQINFQAVEKERANLIEKLSKTLPKDQIAALVTKSLEFRLNKMTSAEYHGYLLQETQGAGEKIDNYPNLKKYVDYIGSHEGIDMAKLFEDADDVAAKIKEAMLKDPSAKRLNEISRGVDVLDNFLNLKLVPRDFAYYKGHRNDFMTSGWVDFINKEISRNKVNMPQARPALTIDKNLATLARFYEIANERDDTFVKNTIKLMNDKNQQIAVLITGGFHTPSLTKKFRECGLSYIVIAPHTTQQTDPEQYRYILKYKSGREE